MKTVFEFDMVTGELLGYIAVNGNHRVIHHCERIPVGHYSSRIRVDEGEDAEREFFNYFGDDEFNTSWPPGWYAAITKGWFTKLHTDFTRESWKRENYSPPPRSWQTYFGVHCPDREPFKIDPEKYRRDYS